MHHYESRFAYKCASNAAVTQQIQISSLAVQTSKILNLFSTVFNNLTFLMEFLGKIISTRGKENKQKDFHFIQEVEYPYSENR